MKYDGSSYEVLYKVKGYLEDSLYVNDKYAYVLENEFMETRIVRIDINSKQTKIIKTFDLHEYSDDRFNAYNNIIYIHLG